MNPSYKNYWAQQLLGRTWEHFWQKANPGKRVLPPLTPVVSQSIEKELFNPITSPTV